MGNMKIYKRHLFTKLISAKLRPVITDKQRNGQGHGSMAIGEIADLPKNFTSNLCKPSELYNNYLMLLNCQQ